jgi:hypothetical protein
MIVLKTESQVKNFVKRMEKIYEFHRTEGCGCCSSASFIDLDLKKKRVVNLYLDQSRGSYTATAKVLAVIRCQLKAQE